MKDQAKYRPVLTASDISHICTLARADASKDSLHLLGVMARFEYMIHAGAISPAYTPDVKESLESSLGFTPDDPKKVLEETLLKTHEEEYLYNQWLANPIAMTVDQLKRVQLFRYKSGKMTTDEERKYEHETLGL